MVKTLMLEVGVKLNFTFSALRFESYHISACWGMCIDGGLSANGQ